MVGRRGQGEVSRGIEGTCLGRAGAFRALAHAESSSILGTPRRGRTTTRTLCRRAIICAQHDDGMPRRGRRDEPLRGEMSLTQSASCHRFGQERDVPDPSVDGREILAWPPAVLSFRRRSLPYPPCVWSVSEANLWLGGEEQSPRARCHASSSSRAVSKATALLGSEA